MNERNSQLKSALGAMATKERVVEVRNVPKEDTVNRQGFKAYSLSDELRLISMLNTLKIQPQFYRSEGEQMKELRDLIERIGTNDPYFVAQAIVYSRCAGEGMRAINHLAAGLVAPFTSGLEWARRFYGAYNKKESKNGLVKGGTIFRLDDMSEIKDVWAALNEKAPGKMKSLPNAMKKGFASVLETVDAYTLAKYKDTVIDIANLCHPDSRKSAATVTVNGEVMKVIDAIMKGITVSADTWETANSEAGQEVAKAVKAGKITKEEGEKILAEAKADNWEGLLKDGKLGVLAALRNIRSIMKNPRKDMIDAWCKLVTDAEKVRKALILPIHFDLAYDVVMDEFAQADYSPEVQRALLAGYEAAIPNIKDAFTGKTCVIVDCSGSMSQAISDGKTSSYSGWSRSTNRPTKSCSYKAGLVAATFAKATNADIIKFGTRADYFSYYANTNVFALAKQIGTFEYGGTDPRTAFDLMRNLHKTYDRIIFISDNEMNGAFNGRSYNGYSDAYKQYVHDVCSPYIYNIDLAAYGTCPLKNDGKVSYYFGYGPSMFEDVVKNEFNPNAHIDKVRKVII